MEGKHRAASRIRVQKIGELSLDAGAFVQERQRPARSGQEVREASAVLLRLHLNSRECIALRLRLHDTDRLFVHKQEVVSLAMTGLKGETRAQRRPWQPTGSIHRGLAPPNLLWLGGHLCSGVLVLLEVIA